MSAVTTVDLMRHGACEGGEIFRGITDVPLSELGWRQMHDALQGKTGWNRIVSSPLQRCRTFAERQAELLRVPLVVADAWREIHFGVWEGREISEVWANDKDTMARYFGEPGSVTPEGGETITAASERLATAWTELLQCYRNENLLIVQHGGTIRLLLVSLFGMPVTAVTQFEVPYASITRIKVFHNPEGNRPVLVSHNAL